MGETRTSGLLTGLNHLKWRVAYKGILVGIGAGILAALYRLLIEYGSEQALKVYAFLRERPAFLPVWFAAAALAALAIHLLVRLEPYAKGSGIPQVEGIVLLGMKIRWYTTLVVRFLAGTLGSLFGLSLGREGPSIQIGACAGQVVAKTARKNKIEENCLITAGASAGLAAAFSAPLAGILFSLEEVHRSFSPNILLAATTAALTADVVSKVVFGLQPVLHFVEVTALPVGVYLWLLPLGIACGLIGALANKSLLAFGTLYDRLPAWTRPAIALLLALPCGLFLPDVLGGGQGLIRLSEGAAAGIGMLCLLLGAKLLFTSTSFGSGIPGGIFLPVLSMGALAGCAFGKLLLPLGVPQAYIPAFYVCAMAGVLAACVKAPITSILLMAEMTGSLVHLLPVAAVAFTALLTSDLLRVHPIYEVLLERIAQKDSPQARPRPGAIVEIPVEPGSEAERRRVCDVSWPEGTLVVGVRRGNREFAPNGSTLLQSGDYLAVLAPERRFAETRQELLALCRAKD